MPTDEFVAHLCLRAPDGIVIVDTCPSREAFEAFAAGDGFRDLRRRHGVPDPTALHDYPVHAAFVDGKRPAVHASRVNGTAAMIRSTLVGERNSSSGSVRA